MKQNLLSVLCLLLLLCHTHFSFGKGRGGGSSGKSSGSKRVTTPSRGGSKTNTNTGSGNTQGSSSQDGHSSQPGHHGSHGRSGSYGRSGSHGRHDSRGDDGSYGGYPGGYMNTNPNNKILSPRYRSSFGRGGHGARGGSPFSRSVQSNGFNPSQQSKSFGRTAVVAAAGGAVAGMALGYGLGRFPRPHFDFRSRQEEYYYNHYMYKKYGSKSTDTNDYSRDYRYSKPPESYHKFMDSCINKTDLLPVENWQSNKKPAATTKTTTTVVTPAPDNDTDSNPTESNSTAAGNSSSPAPSTPRPLNQPVPSKTATDDDDDDDDDDTVSIVEIGYPELIKQMKVKNCVERYMAYSHQFLTRTTGGVQGLEMGSQGLLAVVTSTILMLMNSNMLTLLH